MSLPDRQAKKRQYLELINPELYREGLEQRATEETRKKLKSVNRYSVDELMENERIRRAKERPHTYCWRCGYQFKDGDHYHCIGRGANVNCMECATRGLVFVRTTTNPLLVLRERSLYEVVHYTKESLSRIFHKNDSPLRLRVTREHLLAIGEGLCADTLLIPYDGRPRKDWPPLSGEIAFEVIYGKNSVTDPDHTGKKEEEEEERRPTGFLLRHRSHYYIERLFEEETLLIRRALTLRNPECRRLDWIEYEKEDWLVIEHTLDTPPPPEDYHHASGILLETALRRGWSKIESTSRLFTAPPHEECTEIVRASHPFSNSNNNNNNSIGDSSLMCIVEADEKSHNFNDKDPCQLDEKKKEETTEGTDSLPREFNLSGRRIARRYWLRADMHISETTRKRVNYLLSILDMKGFELRGTPGDGDCFFHAFMASYDDTGISRPLLDRANVDFLRSMLPTMIGHTDSGRGQQRQSLSTKGEWVYFEEGALLADQFNLYIRVITAEVSESGRGYSDMLRFPNQSGRMDDWESINKDELPSMYLFIVDLIGHFAYARKKGGF